MRTLTFIFCLFATCALSQDNIKFLIGNDPITGKKLRYESSNITITNGTPVSFDGSISVTETNGDPAQPTDSTARGKKLVSSYPDLYSVHNVFIISTTKLYVPSLTDSLGAPIPNAISLGEYFKQKFINSYPGVAGGDPLVKGIEGLCKEMIEIRIANGEF